jgi:hypothetical protein
MRDFDGETLLVNCAIAIGAAICLAQACDSTGNDDNTVVSSVGDYTSGTPETLKIVLKSAKILPTAGGLIDVTSARPEHNGASLCVPAHAIDKEATVSLGVTELPAAGRVGQTPVGAVFALIPTGLQFTSPATLALPVPIGVDHAKLYIGVFDPATGAWQNLGGTVDGDYISAPIVHLSTYGVFSGGKSTVALVNNTVDAGADNVLTYLSGPVPPSDLRDGAAFPADPPPFAPGTQFTFQAGASQFMDLAPGQYSFLFSYPSPQPAVANVLSFLVPAIQDGADDGELDQTVTLTDSGATSNNPLTMASIHFTGRNVIPGSNKRPILQCNASAPAGVPITSGETSGQLPSRLVNVGPIKIDAFRNGEAPITLFGTPVDPEGAQLSIFWTVYDPASGNSWVSTGAVASGGQIANQNFRPSRGGTYVVYATAYDDVGLFDQCHWTLTIVPNQPAILRVVVDDFVLDFGRLDAAPALPGPGSPDRRVAGVGPDIIGSGTSPATSTAPPPGFPFAWPSGFAIGARGPGGLSVFANAAGPIVFPAQPVPWSNLCGYVDTTGDGVPDSTILKLLTPIEGNLSGMDAGTFFASAEPHVRPLQYPDAMTCVYALYSDPDGDGIQSGGFRIPAPLFDRGNLYAAISIPGGAPFLLPDGSTVASQMPKGLPVGSAIDTQLKLDAYNATLTAAANAGLLSCQFSDNGALIPLGTPGPCAALPVIFEAPDDPDSALLVHDCRHLTSCPTPIPRGGTIAVEARVTDGYNPEQRQFGVIAYPDVESVLPSGLTLNITPVPADPAPGQSVTVTACVFPPRPNVAIEFAMVGTDGYTHTSTPATGQDGCANFVIPGGAQGVVDVVTVTVDVQPTVVSAVASNVSYTF